MASAALSVAGYEFRVCVVECIFVVRGYDNWVGIHRAWASGVAVFKICSECSVEVGVREYRVSGHVHGEGIQSRLGSNPACAIETDAPPNFHDGGNFRIFGSVWSPEKSQMSKAIKTQDLNFSCFIKIQGVTANTFPRSDSQSQDEPSLAVRRHSLPPDWAVNHWLEERKAFEVETLHLCVAIRENKIAACKAFVQHIDTFDNLYTQLTSGTQAVLVHARFGSCGAREPMYHSRWTVHTLTVPWAADVCGTAISEIALTVQGLGDYKTPCPAQTCTRLTVSSLCSRCIAVAVAYPKREKMTYIYGAEKYCPRRELEYQGKKTQERLAYITDDKGNLAPIGNLNSDRPTVTGLSHGENECKYGSVSGRHESFTDAETVDGLSYVAPERNINIFQHIVPSSRASARSLALFIHAPISEFVYLLTGIGIRALGNETYSLTGGDFAWEHWQALTSTAVYRILDVPGFDGESDDEDGGWRALPSDGAKNGDKDAQILVETVASCYTGSSGSDEFISHDSLEARSAEVTPPTRTVIAKLGLATSLSMRVSHLVDPHEDEEEEEYEEPEAKTGGKKRKPKPPRGAVKRRKTDQTTQSKSGASKESTKGRKVANAAPKPRKKVASRVKK
ncbi:hypothetical protein C8R45DRAFT_933449 [Mycena sanguinolenta]|nr:hypothetical protein C8R45DRAFT_933449 [Mycena sanguinolenta]